MVKKYVAAMFAALLGLSMFGSTVLAQDATPAADCPTTTAEENIEIVNSFLEAVVAADHEAADAYLHPDHTHDLTKHDTEVSQDFLTEENAAIAAESNHSVDAIIAQGEWVAVDYQFEVSGADVEGADPEATATVTAIAMVRIECGQIIESLIEFDSLGLLLELGYEVTPPGDE